MVQDRSFQLVPAMPILHVSYDFTRVVMDDLRQLAGFVDTQHGNDRALQVFSGFRLGGPVGGRGRAGQRLSARPQRGRRPQDAFPGPALAHLRHRADARRRRLERLPGLERRRDAPGRLNPARVAHRHFPSK